MKRDSKKQFLPKAVGLTLMLMGGVAFAQGVSHMAPAMVPGRVVPPSATGHAANVRQRIINWFTAYDQIRLQAQMTPAERHSAHKLMSDLLAQNPQDKRAGQALLSRMEGRYVRASTQLKALPPLPQTAELQKGYEEYFQTGRRVFEKYLKALSSDTPQNVLLDAQRDKYQMGMLDISNKVLDHKLRKQYDIAAFPND